MKSEPDNNKAERGYVFSDDSTQTLDVFSRRTAEKQAGWFLPYLRSGMKVLDCGCASGSITVGLAKAVEPGQATGIDISGIEIDRAKERAAKDRLTNISFEVGNVYELNFSDNSYDALFSNNVIEHVPEPSRALQEMKRVLKPGGIIGIRDVDMSGYLLSPDDELLRRYWAVLEADWENAGGRPRIGRHLGRLLHETGFKEVKMSVSYDLFSDSEGRKLGARVVANRLTEGDYVDRVIGSGLTNAEELEDIKEAYQDWQELPFGFYAQAECEAIGRKALHQ